MLEGSARNYLTDVIELKHTQKIHTLLFAYSQQNLLDFTDFFFTSTARQNPSQLFADPGNPAFPG